MKVLANDGISESGINKLEEYGFSVDLTKVAQEQLVDYINTNSITSLLVRSATQVRKDIIDNCGFKVYSAIEFQEAADKIQELV